MARIPAPSHERDGARDALDAFLRSIRPYAPLPHAEVLELARTRTAAEAQLRQALFSIPELVDALLADWRERREAGRVTGVMAEDDGTPPHARTRRVDGAFEQVARLREPGRAARGSAAVGRGARIAEPLQAAGLSCALLVAMRRRLTRVRGARARAALARADVALERWIAARERLVRHNLRLVVSVAKRARRVDVPFVDLIQEGVIGLVRAAEKFDPERGFHFSTYAVWWIEQAIIRAVQKQARSVRLPAHLHDQQQRYRRAVLAQAARGPEAAGSEQLAECLGLGVDGLDRIRASLKPLRSLDAPVADDADERLADRLADREAPDPDDAIARSEIRRVLQRQLRRLDARDLEILSRRFGLDGRPPQTLDAIGRRLGLSRERVRQIERRLLDRLGEAPAVQRLVEAAR